MFTYADGVNNPTDFTAALSARVPAVLQASKKPGDYLGAPVNSGPFDGGPSINSRSVDPNLDPQRGNSGVVVIPKEIHTLNDAILAAGKSLSTRPQGSRRIIYVISDGKESRSKANFREVVRYLEGNQVAVYGTLVGDSATWGLGYLDRFKLPLLPLSPDNILPKYTAATGGHLYSEFSTNGIQRSFAELAVSGAHPIHPWLLQSRSCPRRQIPQRSMCASCGRISMSSPRRGTTLRQPTSRDDRSRRLTRA